MMGQGLGFWGTIAGVGALVAIVVAVFPASTYIVRHSDKMEALESRVSASEERLDSLPRVSADQQDNPEVVQAFRTELAEQSSQLERLQQQVSENARRLTIVSQKAETAVSQITQDDEASKIGSMDARLQDLSRRLSNLEHLLKGADMPGIQSQFSEIRSMATRLQDLSDRLANLENFVKAAATTDNQSAAMATGAPKPTGNTSCTEPGERFYAFAGVTYDICGRSEFLTVKKTEGRSVWFFDHPSSQEVGDDFNFGDGCTVYVLSFDAVDGSPAPELRILCR